MNRDVCEHFVPTDLLCDKCKQPTALRLAGQLESEWGDDCELEAAAAELRRLHAALERCRKACAATSQCWRADADRWMAQRDALLEALKRILQWDKCGLAQTDASVDDLMNQARAAIKSAEENSV